MTGDFLCKLPMYKTAKCVWQNAYVAITGVTYDSDGKPIIHARYESAGPDFMFRVQELTDFCL